MAYKKMWRVIFGFQHVWIFLTSVLYCSGHSADEPGFLAPLKNVTVVQGKDASFTCMVNNLGGHRIAWIKVDTKAILAIHDNVITNNGRLSVTMNDKLTWTLHVRNAQPSDAGTYMCQINSEPMKNQLAGLEVVTAPDFIPDETSNDVMVPEGGTAKLICRAKGHPKPQIRWLKEDGSHIIIKDHHGGGKRKVKSYENEMLNLTKIVRSEMGAYLCIASNNVPPSISKRIMVSVHFHPLIQVPTQMVAVHRGLDVTIECYSEASPKSIAFWQKETGEMIISNEKFNMTEELVSQYGVRMRLQIRNLSGRDFTGYRCISQNSMGSTEGTIHIHEIPYSTSDRDKLPPPADSSVDEENPDERRGEGENADSTLVPLVEHYQPIDTPRVANEGNNHPVIHPLSAVLSFTLPIVCYLFYPSFHLIYHLTPTTNY